MDVLIKYLLLACFGYVYLRLLIPYVGFFARYMFNEPTNWNKYIEKPRLVFYGIGLLLMHSSNSTIMEYASEPSSFFYISNWVIFLGGIVLSQITWSEKFKTFLYLRSKRNLKTA